jgi:DNA-binding NarL/FixJ family response regulator
MWLSECSGDKSQAGGQDRGIMQTPGPNELGLRFTTEETILLRGLAKGNTIKQIARLLRLPRESLFRVLGDLRNKTGMLNDTTLAAWALRNVGSLDRWSAER